VDVSEYEARLLWQLLDQVRSHRDVVHRRIYRGNAVRGLRRTVVDR
jgi:hypothetical protein